MDDARSEQPTPEFLGDADTVSFSPPSRSRGSQQRRRWALTVGAFAVGAALGAGALSQLRATPQTQAQPIPTTTTVVPEPVLAAPAPVRIAPVISTAERAVPRGSYRVTCDAQSHSFDAAKPGPRLVASVLFDNSGNVGASYEFSATWRLSAGSAVTRSIQRDVPPGVTLYARITLPASAAEVAANRATPGAPCTTRVSLLSIFGDSYR